MKFFKEFRDFAVKGNMMDMAVGVIIGGAFSKLITSLVNDIIMPPVGALIGNTDFSKLKIDLSPVRDVVVSGHQAVGEQIVNLGSSIADSTQVAEIVNTVSIDASAAEPIYWCYGAFIQQCVDFLILAFCVFLMVRIMNRIIKKREQEPPKPAEPTNEEKLLTEIRDLLKK